MPSPFDGVLVVTVRKSFWASSEAHRWPRAAAHSYDAHAERLAAVCLQLL
jgi:hypothetical protein